MDFNITLLGLFLLLKKRITSKCSSSESMKAGIGYMSQPLKDVLLEELRTAFYRHIEANQTITDSSILLDFRRDLSTSTTSDEVIQTLKHQMAIERDLLFHSLALLIDRHLP